MPSFSDSAVIFLLALLLFGPKKLPVLARELGKWIGEFRRASNEFKMQMEEELRISEQADRAKEIAAMEAAAPPPAVLPGVPTDEPEHPHIPPYEAEAENTIAAPPYPAAEPAESTPAPLPIATSGELNLMPPSSGLPMPRTSARAAEPAYSNDLAPLLDSIPAAEPAHGTVEHAEESPVHG